MTGGVVYRKSRPAGLWCSKDADEAPLVVLGRVGRSWGKGNRQTGSEVEGDYDEFWIECLHGKTDGGLNRKRVEISRYPGS